MKNHFGNVDFVYVIDFSRNENTNWKSVKLSQALSLVHYLKCVIFLSLWSAPYFHTL